MTLLTATFAVTSPIPWVDQPLPLYHLPAPRLIPYYPAKAPPCAAASLRVHQGRTGAATGNLLDELIFTNTGPRPCLLRGYPRVEAEAPSGRRIELHPTRGTFFGPLVAADIPRHGHTFLDFGTGDGCDGGLRKPTHYKGLAFTLPSGASVSGGSVRLNVICGLSMSSFGLRPRYTGSSAPPGTPGVLHARIELPRSTTRGSALSYTVMLSNPTNKAVTFARACPGYTQGLFTAAAHVHGSYRLNCAPAGTLPPQGTAAFAMKIRVPKAATLGVAKVGWNLDTPTGPFAGGIVTITG